MNITDSDSVTCMECNAEFKSITTSHLKFKHNMTMGEYITKFPDAPVVTRAEYEQKRNAVSASMIGIPAHNKGKPMSDNQKKKISLKVKSQFSDGTRIHWNKGNTMSEETKAKISNTLKGRVPPVEVRQPSDSILKDDYTQDQSTVPYLTEDSLGELLSNIFDEVPVRNKAFPGHKFRPDYRFDQNRVVVEFDGYRHYSLSKTIVKDSHTTKIMEDSGYKVIRIPYFIQMCPVTIKLLFDKTLEYKQTYPHGFVSDVAMLPADFCSLGVERFVEDLKRFSVVRDDIIATLRDRINQSNVLEVIPPSLSHLL